MQDDVPDGNSWMLRFILNTIDTTLYKANDTYITKLIIYYNMIRIYNEIHARV